MRITSWLVVSDGNPLVLLFLLSFSQHILRLQGFYPLNWALYKNTNNYQCVGIWMQWCKCMLDTQLDICPTWTNFQLSRCFSQISLSLHGATEKCGKCEASSRKIVGNFIFVYIKTHYELWESFPAFQEINTQFSAMLKSYSVMTWPRS